MNRFMRSGSRGSVTRGFILTLALLQLLRPITSVAEDLRLILDSGYYCPPGKTPADYEGEAYCAGFISAAYSDIFLNGQAAEIAGVSGNAWDFPKRIRSLGGSTAPAVQESLQTLLPGDIIGLRYRFTRFLQEEKQHGFTHIALVLDSHNPFDPIILHLWQVPPNLQAAASTSGAIRIESLSELETRFPGVFEPRVIMRPLIP